MNADNIPRQIAQVVRQRLSQASPAVVLLGPRQVGKTTLARQIAADWPQGAVYLDMEMPSDRQRLSDAEAYLRAQSPKLVVVDEIHRVPELFAVLRGLIDERRASGQRFGHFLLLGSASLDLMRQSSESLAGRVAYLEMGAITADEAQAVQLPLDQLWSRGGKTSSARTWSAMCPCLHLACPRRRSGVCGLCWRTSRAACSIRRAWQPVWT